MAKPVSPAEFEVMEALWSADGPLGAAEVAEKLKNEADWSLKTVKTLLARLTEKGAIAHQVDGRRYLYRPAISRDDYAKTETRGFVQRLFGGRAAPLVAHLADDRGLSADDIKELEALLSELKNDSR